MKVFVNDKEIDLAPGMTVRHALMGTNLTDQIENGARVYDQWGNKIGLDGALSPGSKIYIRKE